MFSNFAYTFSRLSVLRKCKNAKAHFAFFFQFFLLPLLCNTYGRFSSEFSQQLLDLEFRIMKFCLHFQVGKVYCVNGNLGPNPHFFFNLKFSIVPSVTLI